MMKRFLMPLFILILCIISSVGQFALASGLIDVSIRVPEGTIGNNFYKDNLPLFEINIKNLSSEALKCKYTGKVINADGKEVFSVSGVANIETGKVCVKNIEIPAIYYGVQVFKLDVDVDGLHFFEEVPFTLSNHTSDMPHNYRFGVTTHFNRNRGELKTSVPLMAGAGIGGMRSEDMMWPNFEQEKGVYKLTDYQEEVLDTLDKNDIKYMFILNFSNDYYHSPASEPVNDKEGYEALSKFTEELLKQAKGRIDYIEVWNEYHSSVMSGTFSGNAEVFAEIHKAIYKGVQNGDKNVKVCGFVEDDWGFYETGMVTKTLKELNGEKAFDYVSLHPYPDDKIRYFEGDVNSEAFIEDVRAELEKYGYSKDTPIIFSELGWSKRPEMYSENQRAAYIVRASAYSQVKGLADAVYNYNLLDYWGGEKWGLVESYQEAHTEHGITYFGKPSYVAIAYYNGLMAENTCRGEIDTKSENSYCYSFTDRLGRNILMLGTFENGAEEKVYINTGVSEVTVSDMFGNEKKVLTNNGILLMNLKDEPQYIIGCSDDIAINDKIDGNDLYAATQTGENSAWIYGRIGDGKTEYTISVYAPGRTYVDLNDADNAKNTDTLVYFNQGQTDENGILDIEFNMNGESGDYNIYIYSENKQNIINPVNALSFNDGEIIKETVIKLGLYKNGSLLKNNSNVLEKDDITVKATLYKQGENTENAVLVYAFYDEGVLKAMDFVQGNSADLSEAIALEKSFTVPDGVDKIKGFLWDDFKTQKPEAEPVEVTVTQ